MGPLEVQKCFNCQTIPQSPNWLFLNNNLFHKENGVMLLIDCFDLLSPRGLSTWVRMTGWFIPLSVWHSGSSRGADHQGGGDVAGRYWKQEKTTMTCTGMWNHGVVCLSILSKLRILQGERGKSLYMSVLGSRPMGTQCNSVNYFMPN